MSAVSTAAVAGIAAPGVATRYGVKGRGAEAWLAASGIIVPPSANRVARWPGGRCLRLGQGEFLVERDAPGASPPVASAPDTWTLLRSDHSLVLDGPRWPDELAQVCSFDFARLRGEPDLVVMTLLAGIGVTFVREPRPGHDSHLALRLWCDASYACYLDECLHTLAARPIGETP